MNFLKLALASLVFFLVACDDTPERITQYNMPEELKDCVIFRIKDGGGGSMKVVRCPNSATTVSYAVGKTTETAVVIDGVKYVPAELPPKQNPELPPQ